MNLRLFLTVFSTVFVAEIGDKTQLATFLFASSSPGMKLVVFSASSLALVAASAIAVLAGSYLSQHLNPKLLSWGVGIVFIAIGIWTIVRA